MDKCGLWATLGFNKLMVYSMHNIDNEVGNCKFNNLFHLV
jgi:hypothetical protein